MQLPRKKGVDTVQKRLFTVHDAGTYLSISHWTVRKHIDNGLIPFVRLGRLLMIDRQDLDSFIESLKDRHLL